MYSPDGNTLIVTHQRSYRRPGSYVSLAEHRPPNSTPHGNLWTRQRYDDWSMHIGVHTHTVITILLNRPEYEEQAFATCENVLGLSTRYSYTELEAACATVLATKQYVSYRTIKNTLTAARTTGSTTSVSGATGMTTLPTLTPAPGAGNTRVDEAPAAPKFTKPALRGFEAFAIPTRTPEAPHDAGAHTTKEAGK